MMAEKLCRHLTPLVLLLMVAAIPAGCSHIEAVRHGEPLFHCSQYGISPDSIDLRNGVILSAEGDSAIVVRVDGNMIRTIRSAAGATGSGPFEFSSDYPVFDALFRMERERGYGERYSFSVPYEIYLNPFAGGQGVKLLMDRVRSGYVVPPETRRYSWPVINGNPQWIVAACELYNLTADKDLLREIMTVSQNVIAEERRVSVSPSSGLVTGVPRYMVGGDKLFPEWMNDANSLMENVTFSTNVAWWWAVKSLDAITASQPIKKEAADRAQFAFNTDSLRSTLFREFWNPVQGHFAALLYGNPLYPMQLCASDNLAQAMAILAGLPLGEMSEMIMEMTPAPVTGVSLFTPRLTSATSSRSVAEALTQTYWALAASRTDNGEAYENAVGALIFTLANDILAGRENVPYVRQPLTGLILRGFCGLSIDSDGLRFSPSVPRGMPGTMKIGKLRYRHAQLTVILHGTGNTIAMCELDGSASEPFFPATFEGEHTLEITLAEGDTEVRSTNIAAPGVLAPPPSTIWRTPREATFMPLRDPSGTPSTSAAGLSAGVRFLYLDGMITEEVPTSHYELFDSPEAVTVQFCNVTENRWTGFATAPHLFIPEGKVITVNLAEIARGGSRIIEDRKLAARFVESNRYKNPRLSFDVEIAEGGRYAAEVHYINGLGIVNSRRRTAVRRFEVDGEPRGVFVFPQLSAADWDNTPDREWQNHTAFTNPLVVDLTPGKHRVELRYYQPTPVYIDPSANTVLADYVRIIKLKE